MTCNRPITYHRAHSEIIYYVMCAHFESFQDSVHSLSLRCAIELFILIELCSALRKSAIFVITNRRFCLVLINSGFVSFTKSGILSRFQKRRFCFTFKSAVLSHLKNGGCLASISNIRCRIQIPFYIQSRQLLLMTNSIQSCQLNKGSCPYHLYVL